MQFRHVNRDRLFLLVVYSLSWGLFLLNGGIYWDDWILFRASAEIIISDGRSVGYIPTAVFSALLLSFTQNVFLFRLYSFLLYLGVTLIFEDFLKYVRGITRTDRFYLVLIFAVLPINFARISVAMSLNFGTFLFVFFLACALMTRCLKSGKVAYRIGSLLLFYISFFMPSLLPFYLIPLAFIAYRQTKISSWFEFFLSYLDFCILPLFAWVLRAFFFLPGGLNATYNKVTFSGIFSYPSRLSADVSTFFSELGELVVNVAAGSTVWQMMALWLAFLAFIYFEFLHYKEKSSRSPGIFVLFGVISLLIGIFPYSIVEKPPSYIDWWSREQILLGIGMSFTLYFGLRCAVQLLHCPQVLISGFLSLIIGIFSTINFSMYLDYQRDWYKQIALEEWFKENEVIRTHTSFLLVDLAQDLNVFHRYYRFYEMTGMMKKIFGDERRLMVTPFSGDAVTERMSEFIRHAQYNMKDYLPAPIQYKVIIKKGKLDLSKTESIIRLVIMRLLDKEQFLRAAKGSLEIRTEKVD